MDDSEFSEFIEQLLSEMSPMPAPSQAGADESLHDIVQNKATEIKKPFCEEVNRRYTAIDGVTTKKLASVWSFRDYICEACGKILTQNASLHKHKKYAWKHLETQNRPKEECPKCGKTVSKVIVYRHLKKGCPKNKKVST